MNNFQTSIWLIHQTLTDTITPSQGWLGNKGNKRVLHIPQMSRAGASPYSLMSNLFFSLVEGVHLFRRGYSQHNLSLANRVTIAQSRTFSLKESKGLSTPWTVFSIQAHSGKLIFKPCLKSFYFKHSSLYFPFFCKFHIVCTSQPPKVWWQTSICCHFEQPQKKHLLD